MSFKRDPLCRQGCQVVCGVQYIAQDTTVRYAVLRRAWCAVFRTAWCAIRRTARAVGRTLLCKVWFTIVRYVQYGFQYAVQYVVHDIARCLVEHGVQYLVHYTIYIKVCSAILRTVWCAVWQTAVQRECDYHTACRSVWFAPKTTTRNPPVSTCPRQRQLLSEKPTPQGSNSTTRRWSG